MRGSGYGENVIAEVCAALGILAKYGILGVGALSNSGAGVGAGNPQQNAATVNCINLSTLSHHQDQANANAAAANAAAAAAAGNNVLGALSQINIDSYMGTVSPTPGPSMDSLDIFRHTAAAAAAAAAQAAANQQNAVNQAAMALNNNNNNNTLTLPNNTTMQSVGSFSKTIMPTELTSKEKNVEIPEVIVGAILGEL